MTKFGLYTKNTSENRSHVTSVNIDTLQEARAYFMGMKRLSADRFDKLYDVTLIEDIKPNRNLLFGNQ